MQRPVPGNEPLSAESGEFTINLSFVTTDDCTRARAMKAAQSICGHALRMSKVAHLLDIEITGERDQFLTEL